MRNWKRFERKWSWSNFNVLSRHSSAGTEENHENLSHDTRYPVRGLKPGPPKYEAGVLTTRSRCSVDNRKDKGEVKE
jgi:hypothetical protein